MMIMMMIMIVIMKVDVYDVSRKIGQMYSKMIFDDGYVHCDPHPGNVLVSRQVTANQSSV